MKKILILLSLTHLISNSYGQNNSIDLKKIKQNSTKEKYDELLSRYIQHDSTLSLNDYQIIYYGQAFQENFKPNARHDSSRALNKYMSNSLNNIEFRKVLNYTQMILKDYPLNIKEVYFTGLAYEKLGLIDSSKIWYNKYHQLIKTIMDSGDGKKEKSAFIVISVTDEYNLLNALGLQFMGQALISKKDKHYDIMSLAKNEFGLEQLYFDIDLFFGKWD